MKKEKDAGDLGNRVAKLRKERAIGLRELARKADLSPASLSAVENGRSSPTLATLGKILKALDTSFVDFFADVAPQTVPIFHAGDMRTIRDTHREYTFVFPKRQDIQFEIVEETIQPSEIRSEWEVHEFDIGGVILKGGPASLEIEDEGQFTLKEKDGFYVGKGKKHRLVNLGKKPLNQVIVAYPPRY